MQHKFRPHRVLILLWVSLLLLGYTPSRTYAASPTDMMSAVAGTFFSGYSGDGGLATAAQLDHPEKVAIDGAGNLYILDHGNDIIRKVNAAGTITTVAGTAGLFSTALALDSAGNLYFNDNLNSVINKLDTTGTITPIAGTEGLWVNFLAVDSAGNLYFDGAAGGIDKLDTAGAITPVAGTEGLWVTAIAVDSADTLYFAESSSELNKLDTTGTITPVAGTAGLWITALAVDSEGNVYFTDPDNKVIRKVDATGNIIVLAGTLGGLGGGLLVPANMSSLSNPQGVAVDAAGNLYIADTDLSLILKVTAGTGSGNHPPVAYDETYYLTMNQPFATVLQAGIPYLQAFDPDGFPEDLFDFQWILVSGTSHGTLVYQTYDYPLPVFFYQPDTDFIGIDTFTFKVNDGELDSNVATVTLIIGPGNSTPTSTATPTAVDTPTATPTATDTATNTPTPTATATSTSTATETPTPTATEPPALPTSTSTATETPTPTATEPPTPTDTPTATPTATETPEPTVTSTATATSTATPIPNNPPDCSTAYAEPALLWPPNHAMQPVMVLGVADPEGQPLTFAVNAVWQDEPTNGTGDGDTAVDATLAPLTLRAERSGNGNGRVYHITIMASDNAGGSCTTEIQVGVPHSKKKLPIDGGALYDSTN